MKKYLSAALVLIVLSISSFAFAGDPVPGIDVKITNSETGAVTTTQTDATGTFSVALAEGKYTVCISQEACDHAINTKGTGVSGKSHGAYVDATTTTRRFAVEIPHAERIAVTELLTEGTPVRAKMDTRVVTLSDRWSSSRAGLALSVTGKKQEFVGHVTLMK